MAPSDEGELIKMINTSIDINNNPSAIRYPRGNGFGVEIPSIDEKIKIGKGRVIFEEYSTKKVLSFLLLRTWNRI